MLLCKVSVLILPTYEQGTWADEVVVPVRNIVLMSDEADPLQLSMIGINPATAYLLLNRYVSLTDCGSATGYAMRPVQRSRRFTRSWASL